MIISFFRKHIQGSKITTLRGRVMSHGMFRRESYEEVTFKACGEKEKNVRKRKQLETTISL